eukprot:15262332-Alexandrium_andersonii.AAC.1
MAAAALPSWEAGQYRALAARATYLSMDCPDLVFAAKECCRRMSSPTEEDWAALQRLARYLLMRPRAVYQFPWQRGDQRLTFYADADFAGCMSTRRSTSGGAAMR